MCVVGPVRKRIGKVCKGHLRGLIQPTQVAFAPEARGFIRWAFERGVAFNTSSPINS